MQAALRVIVQSYQATGSMDHPSRLCARIDIAMHLLKR